MPPDIGRPPPSGSRARDETESGGGARSGLIPPHRLDRAPTPSIEQKRNIAGPNSDRSMPRADVANRQAGAAREAACQARPARPPSDRPADPATGVGRGRPPFAGRRPRARLQLAAEAKGVSAFLLCPLAACDAPTAAPSAAVTRWRITPLSAAAASD